MGSVDTQEVISQLPDSFDTSELRNCFWENHSSPLLVELDSFPPDDKELLYDADSSKPSSTGMQSRFGLLLVLVCLLMGSCCFLLDPKVLGDSLIGYYGQLIELRPPNGTTSNYDHNFWLLAF
jgi:hypothetical protein